MGGTDLVAFIAIIVLHIVCVAAYALIFLAPIRAEQEERRRIAEDYVRRLESDGR